MGIEQDSGWTSEIDKAFLAGQPEKAIELATRVVTANPGTANVYMVRGMTYFRAGKIDESIQDFRKANELEPDSAPYNWQLGISLYYAKKYEEGQKQFESHKDVNPNDVENSVWHFLCLAKVQGIEAARKAVIPVGFDRRKPMMEVLKLYRGESTPEKVLAIAEDSNQGPKEKTMAQFYGYLYVGLYYDALGEAEKGRTFLKKCVDQKTGGYMADVARIHLQLVK